VRAVDVRLGEEAVLALAEAVRYCPSLTELKLNHVLANTAPARGALLAVLDALPLARAPLAALDLAHNAQLDEMAQQRLVGALRRLPAGLTSLQA